MAKTKTTTKSSSPKAATKTAVKKAAVKKAAAPKSDAKAAPKKAAVKKAAPKTGAVKKAAPKKAAVKLTDSQANLLKEILGTKEAGLVATKKNQKQLDSLQAKKLIKRGKKEGAFYKYHGTKLGEKHHASTGSSESSSSSAS